MNSGVQLACAMWALTALSLILVGLRLYTRIRIIKFVGAEDHMYAWTGLFLLVFTAATQVSVHYGLGRNFWTLPFEDSSNAIFWTYVANSFAITGNAMAKLSMGLFLLRVVQVRWHKIALWVLVIVTAGTSIALVIMLWNQTTPVKTAWDPLRTPGRFNIEIQPMSVGLGAWSSACDFFFAVFPWLAIWSLRMPQREKIMLASGMSLGVIAGVCGIVRTVVLSRLDKYNYTLNFVPYFGWAGAEIAVAMICVGIPTLRPLYLKKRHGVTSAYGNRGQMSPSNDGHLPRFTMMDHKRPSTPRDGPRAPPSPSPAIMTTDKERQLDVESATTARDSAASSHAFVNLAAATSDEEMAVMTAAAAATFPTRPSSAHTRGRWRDDSVDEILGLYDRKAAAAGSAGRGGNRGLGGSPGRGETIWVKNEVQIRSEDDVNWPLKS